LKGRGINPRPMLDGSGVKAMPVSLPAPNPGSFIIRKEENISSQMGHTKQNILKVFQNT